MPEIVNNSQFALSIDEAETLNALIARATPANTLRAYRQDQRYLEHWCRAATSDALPWPAPASLVLKFVAQHSPDTAMPENVAMRLQIHGLAKTPATVSTTLRRLSTWSSLHRMRELPNPMTSAVVQAAMTALRKGHTVRPKSQNAITAEPLKQLVATCSSNSLHDLRDRCVFLVAYATGGRRRSELCAITCEMLTRLSTAPIAYRLDLPKAKRKKRSQIHPVALVGAAAEAVQAWLHAANITSGPLFRGVQANQDISPLPLNPVTIYRILEKRLQQAQLPRAWASPHGFRSGFLTDAVNNHVPEQAAMQFAQISDPATTAHYYRGAELLEHPALIPAKSLKPTKPQGPAAAG